MLFAACILSACTSAFDEPDPMASGDSEMLSLEVSVSDIVESDGTSSRSTEEGAITTFDGGDKVGLIVLDSEGNILVDNVPYIYDGDNWSFWSDNPDGKQLAYYDAAMSTYIVYYPYDKEVDNSKSVDDIKSKDAFAPQKDQTSEKQYDRADVLVWTSEGKALRHLPVELKHVYDSFSFRIDIKWTLEPINGEVEYEPMKETLKNFKIEFTNNNDEKTLLFDNDDDSQNLTYCNEDGYYRYLLTSGEGGKITWQYTYRQITFRGERTIPAESSGKRFIHHEIAYMGKLPGPNMEVSDFYCIKGDTGYVFPWDAAYRLKDIDKNKKKPFAGHHCIGLVIGVGQHENDVWDYTESVIGKRYCNGYVMSLTDIAEKYSWATTGTKGATGMVGTITHLITSKRQLVDWNGYYNVNKIEEFITANSATTSISEASFPAAYACKNYGGNMGMSSPKNNTTGWFLPSIGMLSYVWTTTDPIQTAWKPYEMAVLLKERFDTVKEYLEFDEVYTGKNYTYENVIDTFDNNCAYWTSNEALTSSNYGKSAATFRSGPDGVKHYTKTVQGESSGIQIKIRPFLVF